MKDLIIFKNKNNMNLQILYKEIKKQLMYLQYLHMWISVASSVFYFLSFF